MARKPKLPAGWRIVISDIQSPCRSGIFQFEGTMRVFDTNGHVLYKDSVWADSLRGLRRKALGRLSEAHQYNPIPDQVIT